MKTILYSTDFSENSENALKYACELRKVSGAELVILHVSDIPTLWNSPDSHAESGEEIEKSVIEHNTGRLKKFYMLLSDDPDMKKKCRFEVREDMSTSQGILDMIDECNADLVVLGVKGESKLKELLVGSTSKAVIEKAKCPVLTIPKQAVYSVPEQIMYAANYDDADISAIDALQKIAKLFNAEITIIHVASYTESHANEKLNEFKKRVEEKVTYAKLAYQMLLSEDISGQLNEYLSVNKFDFIAMLEHGNKSLFNKWFHRDLVGKMEFHSSIPLFSFNEKYLPLHS